MFAPFYILIIPTMFNKQRYISPEDKQSTDDLVSFLLDWWTTKQDILAISEDLEETPWRIRMTLWMLSVRDKWRYKQAFDKFIKIKKDSKLFNN